MAEEDKNAERLITTGPMIVTLTQQEWDQLRDAGWIDERGQRTWKFADWILGYSPEGESGPPQWAKPCEPPA